MVKQGIYRRYLWESAYDLTVFWQLMTTLGVAFIIQNVHAKSCKVLKEIKYYVKKF